MQSINILYKKCLHIIVLSQQLMYKCDNLMTFPIHQSQHKFIANLICKFLCYVNQII